jgi:hypothetical protein
LKLVLKLRLSLAYNMANFLRTLALPEEMASWSLTTIREKLVKIGGKVIAHARIASSRWRGRRAA